MRRLLLSLVLALAATPLAAYTIFLKDGGTLEAREKYTVQGNMAIIKLKNGTTSLPLAQIDVAKTEASNASEYGSALVLQAPPSNPAPKATPRRPSLSDLAAQRQTTAAAAPPPRATPRPVAAAAPAGAKGSLERTPSGNIDFLRAPRTPLTQMELGAAVSELLRANGVAGAGIYTGSAPRRLLVEVSVNSEGSVFHAIAATALAVLDLQARRPGALDGIELFLVTERRQRAGQFLITPERAQELVTKKIDVPTFYVRYVEF